MLKPTGVAVHAFPTPDRLIASALSRRHAIASGMPTPARMAGIADAAEAGKLVPKISRTVSLADAIPALTEFETLGLQKGKLVIVTS